MHEAKHAQWRKPWRSGTGNNCVEVARFKTAVAVRDSKNPAGGELMVPLPMWKALAGQMKDGTFDA